MMVSRGSVSVLTVILVASVALAGATAPAQHRGSAFAGTVRASALPVVFGPETPANGALLGLLNPVTYILVTYLDPNGAVVGVDFHLDGMNLTSAGFFNNTAFTMPVGFAFRDGPHVANFSLADSAGVVAFHNWTFTVDTLAPILVLSSPLYPILSASTVLVAGTAIAVLPQAAPVSVTVTVLPSQSSRQMQASATTGAFGLLLPLSEGQNLILVEATDAAGNPASKTVAVVSDTIAPVVSVDGPADGLETNTSTVVVRGSVDDANATVLVNDQMIRPDSSGQWETTVALVPGGNVIRVSAVDIAGNRAAPILLHVEYFSPVPDLQNGTAANAQSLDEQAAVLRFSLVGLVLLFTGIILVLYSRMSRRIRDDRRVVAELVRASQHKR